MFSASEILFHLLKKPYRLLVSVNRVLVLVFSAGKKPYRLPILVFSAGKKVWKKELDRW
ncbi:MULTISPECIES: hypothetical protein [Calothrix]|uniref:Uncharacterized protein n=2 Tax=Calothrix TaxID=1186 RepID=A0ABR8AAM3_9CYAN|nr:MULTISPECIES: hypothetical protein [Calothrix]MBD2196729.1 hypothetical protein [Calothrix parietina FACHB-288]MBD2224171.1 hypothetical protein [Calothrix anomala FACHB-343]